MRCRDAHAWELTCSRCEQNGPTCASRNNELCRLQSMEWLLPLRGPKLSAVKSLADCSKNSGFDRTRISVFETCARCLMGRGHRDFGRLSIAKRS